MSKRNDYNYYNLDSFDESLSSNEYRRRHPQRRQNSYNGRPAYNVSRRRKSRRNSRRLRNRIIIILAGLIVIAVFVAMLWVMFRGCSEQSSEEIASSISTETKSSEVAVATKDEIKQELSASYFVTPEIEDNNENGVNYYGVYVWNNIGFELFGGSDDRAKIYAETIDGFADKFGDDVTVYDMVVPNHTEMGLPQRLKDGDASSDSQADNIKSIYSHFSDNVTPINCYNYLAEHNSEYIYYNSDHHWTQLGAYYAYTAFAESTNQSILSLENCTEQQIEGFTGSFAGYSDDIDSDTVHYWEFPYDVAMYNYTSESDYDTYESPYYKYATSGSNTYGIFILGDNQSTGLTVLSSESDKAEEGKKIAVVKESYGNAFVPFLTNTYGEVHVIDFRYFTQNLVTYCKDNNIDEVLFLNGIMSANTQIQLDSMSSLFE